MPKIEKERAVLVTQRTGSVFRLRSGNFGRDNQVAGGAAVYLLEPRSQRIYGVGVSRPEQFLQDRTSGGY